MGLDHVLGVENPSPLNTWPRWPPQAVQVISMRVMNMDLSSCRLTAPGIAISRSVSLEVDGDKINRLPSKKAGQPQPLENFVVLL